MSKAQNYPRHFLTKVNLELSPREEIAVLTTSLNMIPNIVKSFPNVFVVTNKKYKYNVNNCLYHLPFFLQVCKKRKSPSFKKYSWFLYIMNFYTFMLIFTKNILVDMFNFRTICTLKNVIFSFFKLNLDYTVL